MHRRTKALAIPPQVKKAVWQRDGGRCILCHSTNAAPCAHIVSRAQGGRGCEENIVTLCGDCHRMLDQSVCRGHLLDEIYFYISRHYPGWRREWVIYKKGEDYEQDDDARAADG